MAEDDSKPGIPAWQRAGKPESAMPAPQEVKSSDEAATRESVGVDDVQDGEAPGPEESASPSSQLEMVEAFLSDPQVKDQPIEKKRAFLKTKDVPVETIDKVLEQQETKSRSFEAKDFQSFQQSQKQSTPAPRPQQQPNAPPIITYPEWMADAHKPPPLITRDRVLTATYLASGIAAVVYGASKFVINPMIGNLTEARHEFHSHTSTKIDQINERLMKLVSKVPEPAKKRSDEAEKDDELESVTSDPTELFHRDIGVQTSPLSSNASSPDSDDPSATKKDPVSYQTGALGVLASHLNDMLDRQTTAGATNKDRKEEMNKLRHSLDTMMYGSAATSLWTSPDEAVGDQAGSKKKEPDAVEDLKKEIRGVKGVLLSARRFPGVGPGMNVGATRVGAGA